MGNAELYEVIDPLLRKWLALSGLERFTIEPGEDHDGDPSVFITAFFEGKGRGVDAEALLNATVEIRDELQKRGDRRHPYIRPRVPDAPEREAA